MFKRTPVKRRRAGVRRGPWRSKDYCRYISEHPCCVCFLRMCFSERQAFSVSQAAHSEKNGCSSKGSDASCVPLCPSHHRHFDADRDAFTAEYRINMKELAEQFYAQWISEGNSP